MQKRQKRASERSENAKYDALVYMLCYILFAAVIFVLLVIPFVLLRKDKEAQKGATDAAAYGALPSGTVTMPYDGEIISSYGWRGGERYNFHNGFDIDVKSGGAVRAYRDGTVACSGYGEHDGYYIVLFHGDHESFYSHCGKITISDGESVSCGDVIAIIDDSLGAARHLHFEIRVNGVSVDPIGYLK